MRSKLFVQGSRPELFAKALAGPADAISIDLEDAVTEDRKDEARGTVREWLRSAPSSQGKLVIANRAALTRWPRGRLRNAACPTTEPYRMPGGPHPTREGWLYISANTPHFWKALCEKTGLQELLVERYESVRKRAQYAQEIVPKLHAALAHRSALEWESLFGEEVPCAASREVEDMFDFPQVQSESMVHRFEHPALGGYRGFAGAWTFDRTPGPAPFAAPALDQHGDSLRAEADRERRRD